MSAGPMNYSRRWRRKRIVWQLRFGKMVAAHRAIRCQPKHNGCGTKSGGLMQEAEQSQDSPGPVATPPPNGILSDMTIVIRNRVHHDLDYHHHHHSTCGWWAAPTLTEWNKIGSAFFYCLYPHSWWLLNNGPPWQIWPSFDIYLHNV